MLSQLTLQQFMDQTANGRIFSIDFIKRTDQSIRTMQARRGVTKGVSGVGMKYDAAARNLLTVYDMAKMDAKAPHNVGKSEDELTKGAFRNVNLSALVGLRLDGKSYKWDQEALVFNEAA